MHYALSDVALPLSAQGPGLHLREGAERALTPRETDAQKVWDNMPGNRSLPQHL